MKRNLLGLGFGSAAGFVMAWAQLTDPAVIRKMLLLQEADVFLFMGSAVAVAALGSRLLRAFGARALVTREPIGWTPDPIERRHVIGSFVFGLGWSVAGTCPGPAAAMLGQGRLDGLIVAAGLLAGVQLQAVIAQRRLGSIGP